MARGFHNGRRGYTVVELMVTVVIVAVLAVTLGVFFVKLLSIREREREEAYIREKLSDICGMYADALSVGSSVSTKTNLDNQATIVKYRHETGGVSLETGVVTRVGYLTSLLNTTNRTVDLNVYAFERGHKSQIFANEKENLSRKLTRRASGDARLIPLAGDMVSCTITPLNCVGQPGADNEFAGFVAATNAALVYLQVSARYSVEDDDGNIVKKTATARRVVRLWNHE